jgi:hypothetical protein
MVEVFQAVHNSRGGEKIMRLLPVPCHASRHRWTQRVRGSRVRVVSIDVVFPQQPTVDNSGFTAANSR